ncbi:Hypothetical predicted protein [Xyrichtys novacula]|uniref:Uncharacterized protein n=1 Tax=Xyrichtys novacula TaxID=13765 RepID=A0AAV1ETB8_XYRNO|nr:Hypothetical predicted protein [Xyrichtys novacula]
MSDHVSQFASKLVTRVEIDFSVGRKADSFVGMAYEAGAVASVYRHEEEYETKPRAEIKDGNTRREQTAQGIKSGRETGGGLGGGGGCRDDGGCNFPRALERLNGKFN